MKSTANALIRRLAGSFIGIASYRLATILRTLYLRFGSIAKQSALFPHAQGLSLDVRTDLKYPHNIRIGNNVIIGSECQIGAMAPVIIEDWVRLSRGVTVETASLDLARELPYPHTARPIVIRRGAWLGAGSMVLGGVEIGAGAVIGAGAIITKDVPAGAVVVGARVRKLPSATFGESTL